eukprot:scaffold79934_cov20-Tisochrysis_lutea.AAC.1
MQEQAEGQGMQEQAKGQSMQEQAEGQGMQVQGWLGGSACRHAGSLFDMQCAIAAVGTEGNMEHLALEIPMTNDGCRKAATDSKMLDGPLLILERLRRAVGHKGKERNT